MTCHEATTNLFQKDIDFVYYTGDIMPHTSWKTTKEGNEEVIRNLFRKFNETFKVPVYTVLGNHESHPTDECVYFYYILCFIFIIF